MTVAFLPVGDVPAIVAGITALSAIVVAALQFRRLRRENYDQHLDGQAANAARWDEVMKSLGAVSAVIDVTRDEQADGFKNVDQELHGLHERVGNLEHKRDHERSEWGL